MSSGIVTPQVIVDRFNTMKMKKVMTYMLVVIHDAKELKIVKEQPKEDTYDFDAFVNDLLEHTEGCYAILDHEPEKEPTKNKLIFISWVPEDAKVKSKMLLSSSKNDFSKKLVGLAGNMNLTSKEDLLRKNIDDFVMNLSSSRN